MVVVKGFKNWEGKLFVVVLVLDDDGKVVLCFLELEVLGVCFVCGMFVCKCKIIYICDIGCIC